MDGAAFCRVQPLRAAIFPAKAATEFADGIEIALEVGKRKIACRVVESFFAGFAGRADRKHARFNRCVSIQAIVAADFEEARIALAMVTIPFERRTLASSESGFESRAGATSCGLNRASRSSATCGIVRISR